MRPSKLLPTMAVIAFLALSCQSPLVGGHTSSVTVTWTSGSVPRTILPVGLPVPATYDLLLTATGQTPVAQSGIGTSSFTLQNLASATWNITVTGKDSGGKAIVQGSSTLDFAGAANASVAVNLSYLSQGSGTGGIDVTLDWTTSGQPIDAVAVLLTSPTGATTAPTATVVGSTTRLQLASAAVGTWRASFTLNSGASARAVQTEDILVLQNVTTTATLTLHKADFKGYTLSTVAGGLWAFSFGDGGLAASAALESPMAVTGDSLGNLYITDTAAAAIRKVDGSTGLITTIAGIPGDMGQPSGPVLASGSRLYIPYEVSVDSEGNILIADSGSEVILQIDHLTGMVKTVAGIAGSGGYMGDGGPATSARLQFQLRVAVDSAGNIAIADALNNAIRYVAKDTGIITTIAGGNATGAYAGDGGPATAASLSNPTSVLFDPAGNILFSDSDNQAVRKIDAASGFISTIAGGNAGYYPAGDGGPATGATLVLTRGLSLDASGNLFIGDFAAVRRVDYLTQEITTVAGNSLYPGPGFSGDGGAATAAQLGDDLPSLFVDRAGDLLIADRVNHRIRKVHLATGTIGNIDTIAGTVATYFPGEGVPATESSLGGGRGIATDSAGNVIFSDANRIRRIDHATGFITTIAGNGESGTAGDGGLASLAEVSYVSDICFDSSDNIFFSVSNEEAVRRIDKVTGVITRVAGVYFSGGSSGDGGLATSSMLKEPNGLEVDSAGDLLIADTQGHRVRRVDHITGIISTVAGTGTQGISGSGDGGLATAASLVFPYSIALDPEGNLYFSDYGRIRRVDHATQIITTVAGGGTSAPDGVLATTADLGTNGFSIVVDSSGAIFISDEDWREIFRVDPVSGMINSIAGIPHQAESPVVNGYPALLVGIDPWSICRGPAGSFYVRGTSSVIKLVP